MESQTKHTPPLRPHPGLKRMDQGRQVLRSHHDAYRPEQTYGQWILRSIHHCGGKTHPNRLGATEVERFLSHLATAGQVSASTQRQALNALVFLDRDVLDKPLAAEIAPGRRQRHPRPPTAYTVPQDSCVTHPACPCCSPVCRCEDCPQIAPQP
jgi:hypothetical protein